MKIITIILVLSILFGCNKNTSHNKTIINSTIQKDTINIQNKLKTNKLSFKEIDLIGKWENKKCNLSFQIFKIKNKYHYTFKSIKRKISNSLEITRKNQIIYLNFKGIEWSENKGGILPTQISALLDIRKMNFVIQNYGNSMNYYTKLEEGCEKYLYFHKKKDK